ncbi:bifunctional DNA-formamidopyrimidine glycosylase/DNA-(apurinic or apyrimidinic site) lyase [Candidatus Woesearchaeota archaeon]|nr:bifunctional DNA-formamidopyrimidine glycosylase/DNA-(apurinic or apyrimidinic site) lyase [Candidatus Woesearchaeota archaeon]
MPELPEAETIVQQLRRKVIGKTLAPVVVRDRKIADSRLPSIRGAKLLGVSRKGKAIVLELDKERFIVVRLGMTGHFHYYQKGSTPPAEEKKYEIVAFSFHDSSLLTYNDVRRFGRVQLFLSKEAFQKALAKLGIDVLSSAFTVVVFQKLLEKRKKTAIKMALMDQALLSGIGNIYAQEALYRARIDPRRKISTLSAAEVKKLHAAIISVLRLAVKHHGTTVENYVHIEGSGGFQHYLQVYQRERCPKGHLLKKEYIGGRGTSYCTTCQK